MSIELEIRRIVIESEEERQGLEGFPETLREAFQILAERLRKSPFARTAGTRPILLESLRISGLSPEEILGARGAERLADLLYRQLLQR